MVRGIFKKVEGVIALVIFISFMIFYLNFVRITLFNSEKYEINEKFSLIDDIFNKLKKEGYIVGFRIYISMYSKDLLCSINDPTIRKDFCERIPFFIPLNLSFLLKYDGVVNNTYDNLLKRDLGIFLYLNLSEFTCEENNDNIIIEVKGPIDSPKIIFISTPILYYWLKNGENILVLSNDSVDFEYCYLLSNGTCFSENMGDSYGIVIKINNLSLNKTYFKILKNNSNNANSFSISDFPYTGYKMIYEPKCHKDINFLVLENLSFNFQDYTDLNCWYLRMNNSLNMSYNSLLRRLEGIYSGLIFYEENLLWNSSILNVGPACINYYYYPGNRILNVYRILFSNTYWFLELVEYNRSNINDFINILNYTNRTEFYLDSYFNFTDFIVEYNISAFTNKLLFKNIDMRSMCRFVLMFLDSTYLVTILFSVKFPKYYGSIRSLDLVRDVDLYILKPRVFYYCISENNEQIAKELYYSYSMPDYEISYINKINYLDVLDLKENNFTAFYLVNKNISIGNKDDKHYSKNYYTYIKFNNSLFEDYLIIYIK